MAATVVACCTGLSLVVLCPAEMAVKHLQLIVIAGIDRVLEVVKKIPQQVPLAALFAQRFSGAQTSTNGEKHKQSHTEASLSYFNVSQSHHTFPTQGFRSLFHLGIN